MMAEWVSLGFFLSPLLGLWGLFTYGSGRRVRAFVTFTVAGVMLVGFLWLAVYGTGVLL